MPQMWEHGSCRTTRRMGAASENHGSGGCERHTCRATDGFVTPGSCGSGKARERSEGHPASGAPEYGWCRDSVTPTPAATPAGMGHPGADWRGNHPRSCGPTAGLARGVDVEMGALGCFAGRCTGLGRGNLGRPRPVERFRRCRSRPRGRCDCRTGRRPPQPTPDRKTPATPRSPLPTRPHLLSLQPPHVRDGRSPGG